MNKNYLIIGCVVLGIVILAGSGFFLLNQSKSDNNSFLTETTNIDADQTKQEDNTSDEDMTKEGSRYLIYDNNALDETANSKRVLFFYANWCPTCRPIDAELRQNSDQIPTDVSVIRVNFNDPETDEKEKELASTYGVTYQHTFVQIDENGNEVTKWSGGGLDEILENIK